MGKRMLDGDTDRRLLRVRLAIDLPFYLRWWMRLTLPIPARKRSFSAER
jgi:hypothetical protein